MQVKKISRELSSKISFDYSELIILPLKEISANVFIKFKNAFKKNLASSRIARL